MQLESCPGRSTMHRKTGALLLFKSKMTLQLHSLQKHKGPQKLIPREMGAIAPVGSGAVYRLPLWNSCFSLRTSQIFFFSPGKTLLFNPQPRLQAPPFAFDAVQTSKMTPCNDKICHQDGWGYSRKKNKGTILSFFLEFNTIKTKGNLYCEVNVKYKGLKVKGKSVMWNI